MVRTMRVASAIALLLLCCACQLPIDDGSEDVIEFDVDCDGKDDEYLRATFASGLSLSLLCDEACMENCGFDVAACGKPDAGPSGLECPGGFECDVPNRICVLVNDECVPNTEPSTCEEGQFCSIERQCREPTTECVDDDQPFCQCEDGNVVTLCQSDADRSREELRCGALTCD